MNVLLRRLTIVIVRMCAFAGLALPAGAQTPTAAPAEPVPHVVFVTGDDEYRSEITMPMLAGILERLHGLRTSVAYARPIPQSKDNIEGLEALETADLMVMFTRFRALPEDQLQRILDFVASGKPVIGLRTSTHAFLYPEGHPRRALNDDFSRELFGQKWITHHGSRSHTEVTIDGSNAPHTILHGVEPFQARSWLYHVTPLHEVDMVLLHGTSVNSNKSAEQQQTYPLRQPVAWTKVHKGAPVFFTTLGHPEDFAHESMRRLVVNAVLWALRRPVPAGGAAVDVPGGYTPPETFDLSKVP